ALRLRHEETGGQAGLVPFLFGVEPLLREIRPSAGGIFPLGGAAHLACGLPNRFCRIQLEARHALRGLASLRLGAYGAHSLEAAADRIADRHADAPRRVVLREQLPEHIAEPGVRAADDRAWKTVAAEQLRSTESVRAIGRLQADVRQLLI